MVRRDISQRYRGTYLGILWSIINPLLMLLIYTFVFSIVFKARWRPTNEDMPIGEFAITLFAGLIPFNFFSEIVNRAPGIIFNYPNYVKKLVFPLEVLVLIISGTALFTMFVSLGVLVVAAIFFLHTLQPTIVFFPLLLIPLFLFSAGLGWFLASLGVYFRDIGQAVSLITQILLFTSPVFYSAESVPDRFRIILKLNPLAMVVTNSRNLLLWGQLFPIREWFIWVVISGIVALLGYGWFVATKKGFADIL